jgi:hypothetical protein
MTMAWPTLSLKRANSARQAGEQKLKATPLMVPMAGTAVVTKGDPRRAWFLDLK